MAARVVVGKTGDGRVVARKVGQGDAEVARLRHEAAVLDRARHPGVVELVGLDETSEEAELVTLFAGDRPLSLSGPPTVLQAAALVASAAATLSDLHSIGVVHGRVDPSHLILGREGRPVLCGFSEAALDHDDDPDGPQPHDDVFALGLVLRQVVEPDTELEPIPDRRRRWHRERRPAWTGYQRRALLTLADQATAPDPRHRPSARALAAGLAAAFPDARLGALAAADDPISDEHPDRADELEHRQPATGPGSSEIDGEPAADRPRGLIALGATVAGLVGLAALLGGVGALRTGPRPDVSLEPASAAPPTTDQAGPAPSSTATSTTSTTAPSPTPPAPSSGSTGGGDGCPAPDGPVADVDGDGCARPITVDGSLVITESGRFRVGEDGDIVLVGDWDCDGLATTAVVRPASGDVFVFERWAADEPEEVEPAQTVEGVVEARAEHRTGCDDLLVTADGRERTLDLGGGA